MAKLYSFSMEVIKEFERNYDITIPLTESQQTNVESESVVIDSDQFVHIAKTIAPNGDLTVLSNHLQLKQSSTSVSLFVVNDATWMLMEKKEEHHDRMLPMVTIPWFYWDETSRNKWGVRRGESPEGKIQLDPLNNQMTISGDGGDFCGIVQRSALKKEYSIWRVIIPEMPESSKCVPRYEYERISVKLNLLDAEVVLYPPPDRDLDYTFSESPKVFYYNGLGIRTTGENVKLRVGRRKELNLIGDVRILMGCPFTEDEQRELLDCQIWLASLYSLLTTK